MKDNRKVKTLVISRKKWLHGWKDRQLEGSCLYRESDGKMCCLGIYLEALGVEKKDLEDVSSPSALRDETDIDVPEARWLFDKVFFDGQSYTTPETLLIRANDDSIDNYIPIKQIPRTIKRLFKKFGDVDVKFVP